jgi:hypothetical protein
VIVYLVQSSTRALGLSREMSVLYQKATLCGQMDARDVSTLFSRLSGREGMRGNIGVARIECSNTQRQRWPGVLQSTTFITKRFVSAAGVGSATGSKLSVGTTATRVVPDTNFRRSIITRLLPARAVSGFWHEFSPNTHGGPPKKTGRRIGLQLESGDNGGKSRN